MLVVSPGDKGSDKDPRTQRPPSFTSFTHEPFGKAAFLVKIEGRSQSGRVVAGPLALITLISATKHYLCHAMIGTGLLNPG